MSLENDIIEGLKKQFTFRKEAKDWLREGKCPECGNHSVYCAATDPKVVKCGHENKCRWQDSVRNLLPELFENWSKNFPQSEADPNAAADAYLQHERGLDLRLLRGTYTQELYKDRDGQTAATVRFSVGESWWERIIDRSGRFKKKANFQYGGKPGGHCWLPAGTSFETLAAADDIWIAEGIFDAVALTQGAHLAAVSNMSVGPYPEHFLDGLRQALQAAKRPTRPRLVFAFDVGPAGVEASKRHIERAKAEGWDATCAQVRIDGEGTKLDWNDLLKRQQSWSGEEDKAPLGSARIEEYLYNGAVTIAPTARAKAKLILSRNPARSSFYFRHQNRIYWCRVKLDEDGAPQIDTPEICNCAFRVLYREYDPVEDVAHYFLKIDFPFRQETVKARFTAAAMSNSAEFKKRLMTFAGMWAGTGEQLDTIVRDQTRLLKKIEPVKVLGYSRKHAAWLLGDIAVHNGRVIQPNSEDYYEFGKHSAKLATAERTLKITYDPDLLAADWLDDLWIAFGPKGLVALAFFCMSVFAVQIRQRDGSLAFLEITGLPGAGKTSLIMFLWRLLGRDDQYEGINPNNNSIAGMSRELIKVSNLPVGLIESVREDEGRSHARRFDYSELLTLYNGGSPRTVGRKTGGYETDAPQFQGALYLMQNDRISAIPAVLERLMSMHFDKSRFSPAGQDAAQRLYDRPLESISGNIIHIARKEAKYLEFHQQRTQHHRKEMKGRVDGLVNDRIVLNHSQLAAAVEALPRLFPNCRPDWIAETVTLIDELAIDRQQSTGGDHPLVADFWDKVDALLWREKVDAHQEGRSVNLHRKPDQLIAINLPEFEKHCRDAGMVLPNMDSLKKVLRTSKSRKFVAASHPVNPPNATGSIRCWVFEQPVDRTKII